MDALNATISWLSSTTHNIPLPSSADEWTDLITRNPKSVTAAAAIVLAVAVLRATTTTTRAGSKGVGGERPPVVGSWVPWMGSVFEMEKDADGFLKTVVAANPGGVVGVKHTGYTFYFVTSPSLIKEVYKQSKTYSMSPIQLSWSRDCFDISPTAAVDGDVWGGAIGPLVHRLFSPNQIMPMVESFDKQIKFFVTPAGDGLQPMAQGGSIHVSLEDFIMKLAFKSIIRVLYGPTFDISDTSYTDFCGFDREVYLPALGYPPKLLRHFSHCREKMIQRCTEYARDPSLDASEYILGQLSAMRDGKWSERDTACNLNAALWPVNANMPWVTLWLLSLQLQHPDGLAPILTELTSAGAEWSASNAGNDWYTNLPEFFSSNPTTPYLNSAIAETMRYTTDSYSMRSVVDPQGAVLGGYRLNPGDNVVVATRVVHMSEDEFERPGEYVPTRFVRKDGSGPKSTEGEYNWNAFGGGSAICLGRHFAMYHIKIFTTVLLKTFKIELDASRPVTQEITTGNRGFGVRRPKGVLPVKVTRL